MKKRRAHIPIKTKLAAALLQLHYGPIGYEPHMPYEVSKRMSADQIIALFEWDHWPIPKAEGGPDEPWNLMPRPIDIHREKTAKIDIPAIAKGKRIRRDQEEFRRRILAKEPGRSARPPSRWPSRPIRNPAARGHRKNG